MLFTVSSHVAPFDREDNTLSSLEVLMRARAFLVLGAAAALSLPGRPPSSKAVVNPATLPGDPSLILNTNIVIAEKLDFMKAVSKIISKTLSKPESYVAVCVNDGLDMIWAGEDTPCALGTLCSLVQINKVSMLSKQGCQPRPCGHACHHSASHTHNSRAQHPARRRITVQ